jgi:hypothetical protein
MQKDVANVSSDLREMMVLLTILSPIASTTLTFPATSLPPTFVWKHIKSKGSTVRDMDTDKIIGYTYNINKLPYLRTVKPSPSPKSFAAVQAYQEHRRLAHYGLPKLKATAKAQGYSLKNIEFHCEPCHLAKAKRQVSHDTPPRSKNIWDLYYADVQLIKPIGFSGYKYYLTIINDKYRVPEIRLLHQKGDASDKLIHSLQQRI